MHNRRIRNRRDGGSRRSNRSRCGRIVIRRHIRQHLKDSSHTCRNRRRRRIDIRIIAAAVVFAVVAG